MAGFLSPEWVADLATTAEGVEVAADQDVTVQQVVVVDGGGEQVRWGLRVAGGRVAVVPGEVPGADVTLTTDQATATSLARGEAAVTDVFMAGRLRLAGDLRALMRAGAALGALDEAFAAVRDRTTWD
jgi:putative sterol carrier protein